MKPFDGLAKLSEECGELIQILGKIQQVGDMDIPHWDELIVKQTLRERLCDEMGDVIASLYFVRETYNLDRERIAKRSEFKESLYARWSTERKNDA